MDGLGGHLARPTARRIFLAVSAVAVVALLVLSRAVLLPFVLGLVLLRLTRVRESRSECRAGLILGSRHQIGVVGTRGGGGPGCQRGRAGTEWPAEQEDQRQWCRRARTHRALKGKKPSQTAAPEVSPRVAPPIASSIRRRQIRRALGEGARMREGREGVWRIEQAERRSGGIPAGLYEGFDRAVAYMRENSLAILEIGRQIVATVSRAIFNLFMTLMLGGYIILTHERIIAFFRELWSPGTRDSFDGFLRRLDRGLSGVVRGQLLICLVNGVLSAIGFWIFDLKYWPILSIVAAVMSLIPIFGSILSSIPAVAIGSPVAGHRLRRAEVDHRHPPAEANFSIPRSSATPPRSSGAGVFCCSSASTSSNPLARSSP